MTKNLLVSLLVVVGCTDDKALDLESVDGQYRVTVEQTANTCNDSGIADAPGLTTRLDLFQRGDGLYDLRWVDGWVPYELAFVAVDLGDGRVRHDIGGATEVAGTVTHDALDLELVYRTTKLDTGARCERRLVARGVRRPMFSPDSVDGRFIVTVADRGTACPDGRVIAPAGTWNMRMEVLPFRSDRTSVLIEDPDGGMMRFWIEPIGRGGAVRLTHDLFFTAGRHGGLTLLDGTIDGTITPDGVALDLATFAKNDPDGCVTSRTVSGIRWIPSSSLDAEYRARSRWTDTCDPGYELTSEDVVVTVEQAGGRVDVIGPHHSSTISINSGTMTPERLTYVIEHPYVLDGRSCTTVHEVDGVARFPQL